MSAVEMVNVSAEEMQHVFQTILLKYHFEKDNAEQCAAIFTSNSVDGIYTHAVNRFPRFIQYVKEGYVIPNEIPSIQNKMGGIEQWNGNLGPGVLNAVHATKNAMALAGQNGIGCVSLANTNHWMRGGYYGWQAAKDGYVFIGWTNTIANMPAWGATDSRLGNNPLVIALPYKDEAIVLDMAMSQYSYGALELSAMKQESLPVHGGYDSEGNLSYNPDAILNAKRPMPVGYWKGAGLSLLLDLLATILSGGLSTPEISKQKAEYGLSQVFIAIDMSKLGDQSVIAKTISSIIDNYHGSVSIDPAKKITYPGERVLQTRHQNLLKGIPVLKNIWVEVNQL